MNINFSEGNRIGCPLDALLYLRTCPLFQCMTLSIVVHQRRKAQLTCVAPKMSLRRRVQHICITQKSQTRLYQAGKDQLLMTLLFLPCSGTSLKNVIRVPEETHQIRSCHHQKRKRTKMFKFSEIVERSFRCALTSSHSSVNSFKSSVLAEPL